MTPAINVMSRHGNERLKFLEKENITTVPNEIMRSKKRTRVK